MEVVLPSCFGAAARMRRLRLALRPARLALVIILVVLLAACTAVEPQVPLGQASFRSLGAGATLGQTFVVHHDGLQGVQIFLQPETPGDGVIRAALHESVDGPTLTAASVPVSAVTAPGMVSFTFPAPLASRQRDYYLSLAIEGAGSVQAAVMPGASYRDGALYSDGRPTDAQLVHAQLFAVGPRLLGFAWRLLASLGTLLVGMLACVLPGLGLLAALDLPSARRHWAERLALALGISVALLPLWLIWARQLGLRPGPWNAWLPVILGAAPLLWQARRLRPAALRAWRPRLDALDLGLIALLLLIALPRLLVVGSLEAPMWGDSYQHAMITQLLLDNGGLFDSWAPYAPYTTLTVQFGFSATAAAIAWFTGMGGVQATIVAGQLLNAAAALALYPLAVRLAGGSRWAGLTALLVAGLLALLPGFYVNWGRYAQLSGHVVLPAALVLTWDLLAAPRRDWRPALLLGLIVAGMALCYYRMAFFYAAFVGVLLLCWALPHWRFDWRAWLGGLGWLALAGAVTALLFAPWALHVANSKLAATMGEAVAFGTPFDYVWTDYQAWALLPTYMAPPLLIVSGAALLWALLRREWMLPGLGLWMLLLAGYMATSLLSVPGAVMLQSFSVMIAIYIPVALACGWLVARLLELAARLDDRRPATDDRRPTTDDRRPTTDDRQPTTDDRRPTTVRVWRDGGLWSVVSRRWPSLTLALILAALAAWGGLQQLRIVDPAHIYVTRPDAKAMRWIASATPPDARFLVQGFDVYGGTSVVGADGGWWIPLLAGRANTMPPQYALANERPDPPDYTERLVELVHELRATPPSTPEGMSVLCEYGITHLYTGQGQGQIGTTLPPLFSPAELAQNPRFTLEYAQDRVTIFSFDRSSCAVAPAGGAPRQ